MGENSDLRVDSAVDGVAVVTIDRPRKANTITDATHKHLAHVWTELERDPSVNAVVLTGSGTVFCGGGDMNGWKRLIDDRPYRRMKLSEARAIVVNMLRCDIPIVAAVNGPAVGLGCSLAIACDLMVMSSEAFLSDTHVPHGLVAGDGGAALLPQLLPVPVARRLLFTGARLSAQEALTWGLAAEVAEPEAVLTKALDLARELAKCSADALRPTKSAINATLLSQINGALESSSAAQFGSFDSDYYRARVRDREQGAPKVAS